MANYYGDQAWSAPARSTSWEQPPAPSRSGNSSTVNREESNAFMSQFEEVDRAIDNLVKSGKMPFGMVPGRRESMPPVAGRSYVDYDPRMTGGSRHHSVSDFDGMRPNSASHVQGYYASQRFQPRGPEADQMAQAKRRMAAQRERELRNYHQEQQYNRNLSGAKSDRSMSPNTMSEEERRELIARQHRTLYGDNSSLYTNDNSRPASQDARVPNSMSGVRNSSPLAYDAFGMRPGNQSIESSVQMPSRDQAQNKDAGSGAQRSRANSTSSPSSNPTTSFSLFDNAQQSSRTSTSSPGGSSGSPPRDAKAAPSGSVAPIGTRPAASQGQPTGNMSKRSTTPLPSPLSYAFTASEAHNNNNSSNNERSTSASSNPSSSVADKGVGLGGWGSNSGVWGTSKNTLGVQSAVWG